MKNLPIWSKTLHRHHWKFHDLHVIRYLLLHVEVLVMHLKVKAFRSVLPAHPVNAVRKELRERHLLEARASLMALDVHLARVYSILIQNPQGCFTTASGNTVEPSKAIKRLDSMSQSLGEKIDDLNRMLTELLKSDKKR